ncbi:hypothetical protein D3C81_1397010 [compost metagenome]
MADRLAPAGGEVEVFLLDVQHHRRFAVVQQVGDDHAHALARTGRGGQDHELLAGQAQQLAVHLAQHDAIVLLLEEALAGQVHHPGKARLAMDVAVAAHLEHHHRGRDPGQEHQHRGDGASGLDAPGVRLHLRVAQVLDVLIVRTQPGGACIQAEQQHGQEAGEIQRCNGQQHRKDGRDDETGVVQGDSFDSDVREFNVGRNDATPPQARAAWRARSYFGAGLAPLLSTRM